MSQTASCGVSGEARTAATRVTETLATWSPLSALAGTKPNVPAATSAAIPNEIFVLVFIADDLLEPVGLGVPPGTTSYVRRAHCARAASRWLCGAAQIPVSLDFSRRRFGNVRLPHQRIAPMPNTIRLHRVLKAPPDRVYRAFLDAEAMSKWLPPNGFTGKVHQIDARVG